MYAGLCDVARGLGYCLAIHGSVITDMDLVAVPWTEQAVGADELMKAIKHRIHAIDYKGVLERDCGEYMTPEQIDSLVKKEGPESPAHKPHGRLAWNLYLYHGVKIDLSVIPRSSPDSQ